MNSKLVILLFDIFALNDDEMATICVCFPSERHKKLHICWLLMVPDRSWVKIAAFSCVIKHLEAIYDFF